MPRILIVSVKAGAGHLKAAEAVEGAFAKYHPDVEVKNIDLPEEMKREPPTLSLGVSLLICGKFRSRMLVAMWEFSR